MKTKEQEAREELALRHAHSLSLEIRAHEASAAAANQHEATQAQHERLVSQYEYAIAARDEEVRDARAERASLFRDMAKLQEELGEVNAARAELVAVHDCRVQEIVAAHDCKLQRVELQLQELERSGGTKESHLSAARHEATQAGVSLSPCLFFFLSMSFFLSFMFFFLSLSLSFSLWGGYDE